MALILGRNNCSQALFQKISPSNTLEVCSGDRLVTPPPPSLLLGKALSYRQSKMQKKYSSSIHFVLSPKFLPPWGWGKKNKKTYKIPTSFVSQLSLKHSVL